MLGAGAGMILLFGSGLDCPENSMILLCGGMAVGLALMYAGAHIADLWMRGMDMKKVHEKRPAATDPFTHL